MKISWNANEETILRQLNISFDPQKDMSNEELEILFESIDDYRWTHEGYDGIGKPGLEFLTCEKMMDKIEDILED